MNTAPLKVTKFAAYHRFPKSVTVLYPWKSRLVGNSVFPVGRGGSHRDELLLYEGLYWREWRISKNTAGLGRLDVMSYRYYSNDSSKESSSNNVKFHLVRNLLFISVFTCALWGSILLWSYCCLKNTFEHILGCSETKIKKEYLYPFDPGDIEFFIKKHCFLWLPSKIVVTPATWKLYQEINRGGSEREIAIVKLATYENLTDSDCLYFALSLDLPTSIALAHNGADPRLFVPPPVCAGPTEGFKTYFGKMFRKILDPLPEENIHYNLNYLLRTTLQAYLPTEEEELQQSLDLYTGFNEIPTLELPPCITETRFLKVGLQALISHTRDLYELKYIPKADLLELLVVIAEKCRDDKEILSLLLKVLANVSCDPSYAENIRDTGCLRILVESALTNDVRLILPAKRALHNLNEGHSKCMLHSGIYQLYPDFPVDESVLEYDVVFIHGILGGAFRTWRQQDKEASLEDEPTTTPTNTGGGGDVQRWVGEKKILASRLFFRTPIESPDEAKQYKSRIEQNDGIRVYSDDTIDLDENHEDSSETQCWPRDWLPEDCPNARIIAVDFDSFATHWTGFCPVETTKRKLSDRAAELLEKLHAAGVGKRPIVWVTHSMGGLLAKSLLCQAAVSGKKFHGICQNTKGVVFYSVPHAGSYIALANTPRRYIFMPTEEALELTNSDNRLTLLHERFKRLWRAYKFKVLSFGEMLETKSVFKVAFKMVPFSSADPEFGDFYPVNVNHLNTCKPHCRGSFLYRKVVELIRGVTDK